MQRFGTIHVLDRDIRRRASVSRLILGFGQHVELYDGLNELSSRPPSSGILLLCDDGPEPVLSRAVEIIASGEGHVPVAVYSSDVRPERIVSAMLSGALDYLSWPFDPQVFKHSIERLGRADEILAVRQRNAMTARRVVETLSPREREVLRGLVNGASNKEIAVALAISPRTVEIHRAKMMRKLNASTTADAVRIGLYAGEDSWLAGSSPPH